MSLVGAGAAGAAVVAGAAFSNTAMPMVISDTNYWCHRLYLKKYSIYSVSEKKRTKFNTA